MNKQQINYINAIYDIEDNIEEMKKYFQSNGFINEYNLAIEIQTSFRSGISQKIEALGRKVLN
jgi:hypothetical protein